MLNIINKKMELNVIPIFIKDGNVKGIGEDP